MSSSQIAPSPAVVIRSDSREGVESRIKENGSKLFIQILLSGRPTVTADSHVIMPVRYRGTDHWEVGFVPKRVWFTGTTVLSENVVLQHYRINDLFRGPNVCELLDGIWERLPD